MATIQILAVVLVAVGALSLVGDPTQPVRFRRVERLKTQATKH